jgi:hypothetical protein
MDRSGNRRNVTLALLLTLAAALAAGCDAGGGAGVEATAAAARAKAQRDWKLQLDWAGASTDLPLQRMDIYLVEEESQYPEIFEIHGEGAMLVGELPMDTHVGYEADYQKLVGKTVAIRPSGGDPREPKTSWVRLGGTQVPVSGGAFTIEKLTGKWEGSEGDRTYWGTLELRVPGADGERTVRGKFAVNCVTWG